MHYFWQKRGLLNWLLMPLAALYFLGHLFNYYILQRPRRVNAVVLCIGNATVGGGGKTPLCLFWAQMLQANGRRVAFISRGYGGKLSSWRRVVKVDPALHSSIEVGDEPLLLAACAPTYISKNRYAAAQMAVQDGAQTIIMDDGLQNNTLYKDAKILVIDGGETSLGNQLLLPAGALREPLWLCRRKVDFAVLLNCSDKLPFELAQIHAKTQVIDASKWQGKKYIAMCGIARPEKFWHSLAAVGVEVVDKFIFADHHHFQLAELDEIITLSKKHKCRIVTTAKDYVRLPTEIRPHFDVLEIEVVLI